MSMAFRGQPQYAQSPMGGYNMSGYGGDAMQALGDIGGFGGFGGYGALSGPATMGGSYSMFGSYNPMPYQQQSYTGGYVPGYGAQLPQQFGGSAGYGGYGGFGGYGGYGGFGGGFGGYGMPQMQQPNVNDLFGQYMFGQYYGQPAFNPFQATSMFGGGRRGGGFGGGFGGGRRGSRQQFQPPAANAPSRPSPPITYDTMRPVPRIFETPAPTPAPSAPASGSSRDLFYQDMINAGLSADAALQATNQRYGGGASPAPAPAPTNTPNTAQPLYSTANDNWGMGLPFDFTQVPANFNWQAYLDAPGNADLRAAGVDTPSEAAKHYLNYGMSENRSLGSAPQAAAPAAAAPADSRPVVADRIGAGGRMVSYGDVDEFGSLIYAPVAPASQPAAQQPAAPQAIEQVLPYYGGQIDMGALPMFVDNYAGLYYNPFSFR